MSKVRSGGTKGGMLKGLKRHNPPAEDKSRPQIGKKYASVNSGAVRNEVAPTPPTLGPRTA